jgi:hypothetical protein
VASLLTQAIASRFHLLSISNPALAEVYLAVDKKSIVKSWDERAHKLTDSLPSSGAVEALWKPKLNAITRTKKYADKKLRPNEIALPSLLITIALQAVDYFS